ncbi:hypothetical protein JCM17843_26900 [Kordiimonadales bacterium JCM 17843]|nr:hypothetical protein JCM17843_26900 [Kordiimonadales bacterium JCM 17843]
MSNYSDLSATELLQICKDEDLTWIDLRFTDPRGKWQHLTMDSSFMDEDTLEEGLMFDGSSIAGWKAINESDMILKPDLSYVTTDPFTAQGTAVFIAIFWSLPPGNPMAAIRVPQQNGPKNI